MYTTQYCTDTLPFEPSNVLYQHTVTVRSKHAPFSNVLSTFRLEYALGYGE